MKKEYKDKLIELGDELYEVMTKTEVFVSLSKEEIEKEMKAKDAFITSKIMYLLGYIAGLKNGDR